MPKLKIGCSDEKFQDYVNLDISDLAKPDVKGDALKMPLEIILLTK